MNKYFAIARIGLTNQFRYVFEYVTGLFRNTLSLLTLYFVWGSAFSQRFELFGYTHAEIVSYILIACILRALVLYSLTMEIGFEIGSNGKFFYYLLKPVGYLKYWFTLDLVSKAVNTLSFLIILLIFIRIMNIKLVVADLPLLILFGVSIIFGIFINFYILALVSFFAFWGSRGWGPSWLISILLDFLSGLYFPLSVLPDFLERIIFITPFPYVIYYPALIFLGKVDFAESVRIVTYGGLWTIFLYALVSYVFKAGLKRYEAVGG